jgi:hypothetical protein
MTLAYTAAALEADLTKAGTHFPGERIKAYLIQGRARASLGHTAAAAASFESAAEEAHRYGYFLWEAFALRDLKLLVLDGMGHSEHGSRRLGAALRQLKGPASALSPMLKGLDPAELTALPVAEAACRVVYEVEEEDPVVEALRQELSGLKLMALQKRAVAESVADGEIEQAMEGDRPKVALAELVVAKHVGDLKAGAAARRRELEALKMLELHARAVACSAISERAIDDAMEGDRPKSVLVALLLEHGGE